MANATIEISARDKTRAAMASIEKNLSGIDDKVAKLGKAFVTLAGAGAIGAVIKKSLDAADAIGKAADAADIGIETLQELRFAADQTGVSTQQLDDGMRRFARRLGLAADSGGPAAKAFDQLGISALDASGRLRNTEIVLNQVMTRLGDLRSHAERAALASAFFGDDAGPKLALLLKQGEAGITKLRQEARSLGLVLSEESVRGAEKANDKLSKLEKVLTTKVTKAVVENAEAIEKLADSLITLTVGAAKAFEATFNFSEGMGEALAKLTHPTVSSLDLIDKKIESTRKQIDQANHIINNDGFFGFGGSTSKEIDHSRQRLVLLNEQLEKQLTIRQRLIDGEKNSSLSVTSQISAPGAAAPGRAANDSQAFQAPITDDLAAFGQSREKFQESLQGRLDAVTQQLITEEQRLSESYVNREMIINQAFENRLIEDERRKELLLQLEDQYQQKILDIQQRSMSAQQLLWERGMMGRLQVTSQVFGQLANLMQSGNKKQFEIGKKAAIAQTVIDTYSMAVKSFNAMANIPIVGPALGAAAAAAAVLYGKVQIDRIKSQQFGSGSGATGTYSANPNTGIPTGGGLDTGGSGSVGNVPGITGANAGNDRQPQRFITINLNGNGYTRDGVRELIEQINEQIGDGATLQAN